MGLTLEHSHQITQWFKPLEHIRNTYLGFRILVFLQVLINLIAGWFNIHPNTLQLIIKTRYSMPITFHLATIPARRKTLDKVLLSLFKQTIPCAIQVYFNYPNKEKFDGVKVLPYKIDYGDSAKFLEIQDGFNLTVDDDIIYPPDYAERLTLNCEMMGCPCGVHGAIIKQRVKNYFKDRSVIHFEQRHHGSYVNMLGTGTLCFHSDIGFSIKEIDRPNMSDCYFAVFCQKNKIPLHCVGRKQGWLKSINYSESLWSSRKEGAEQTKVINQVSEWTVF